VRERERGFGWVFLGYGATFGHLKPYPIFFWGQSGQAELDANPTETLPIPKNWGWVRARPSPPPHPVHYRLMTTLVFPFPF